MSGCKLLVCLEEDDSYLYGLIDSEPTRPTEEYQELLVQEEFACHFGTSGFASVLPLSLYAIPQNGVEGILRYIDEFNEFCRNIAEPMWKDILKSQALPEGWYLHKASGNIPLQKVHTLMHTTSVTLYGLLTTAGLTTRMISYNFTGWCCYGVKVTLTTPDIGELTVGVCPTCFISPVCPDWIAPSKTYYYEDAQLGIELTSTDSVQEIIDAVVAVGGKQTKPKGVRRMNLQ